MPVSGFDADAEASRKVLEISVDCVKILDASGDLVFMNQNGLCVMEIDDFEAFRGKPWNSLWPDAHKPDVDQALHAAKSGGVGRFSAFCPTAKGTPRWWDVMVTPAPDPEGSPRRLIAISRDVTVQRKAEIEREESHERASKIAHEFSHRMNNMLAVVQSIVTQTVRTTPDPAEFSKAINDRLAAMANANRVLVAGDWKSADFRNLVEQQVSHSGPVTLSGPPVSLSPSQAPMVALAFHELAVNATKHGALSTQAGRVALTWSIADGKAGKELLVDWHESGGPAVTPPTRKGFGSKLLDQGIPGAKVTRTFEPSGFECRIVLPLSPALPSPSGS